MNNEPIFVRRVDTIEEAQLLVAWLDDNEIDATIVGGQNPGSVAFGVSDFQGIRIFVADDAKATRATELLEEHDARPSENASTESGVEMTCEECGAVTKFQGGEKDKVQTCSACGAFIENPDETVSS